MFLIVSRPALILWAALFLVFPALAAAQITPEVIEAAKKEGEVMFYGAITVNSSKAIGDAFEKKYGIKLRHWRGDATELINRSLAEARAGKPGFDVTLGNEVVMAALDEKKSICDIRAAGGEKLSQAVPRRRQENDPVACFAVRDQLQPSASKVRGSAKDVGRIGRTQVEG